MDAIPERTKRKAARSATRQTVAEHMRLQIPGEGVFLVASTQAYPHRSYPPPSSDMNDLFLSPGAPVTIDQSWLASPLLIRDFQAGIIKLEFLDRLPRADQMDPDPETVEGLPQTMKLMVRTIVESPLNKQYKDILSLGDQMQRTGLPAKHSRVTKAYLQGEYAVFLRAVAAFEATKGARPEVLELIRAQLERIETL